MPEEERNLSFVDRMATDPNPLRPLHEETSADAGGAPAESGGEKAPVSSAPTTTAGADPRIDELIKKQEKLEGDLFNSQQMNAYWRGEAANARRQPETKIEQPPPYKPDLDKLKTEMEKGPEAFSVALVGEMERIADARAKATGNELEQRVDGKLGNNQRQAEIATQLKTEGIEIQREYSELIGDKGFDSEAFDYVQDLARKAGNPVLPDRVCMQMNVPIGTRAIGPGMMRAGADAVYGRWAKANKLPATKPAEPRNGNGQRSLKEVISTVNSDNLGSNGRARSAGGNRGNGAITTIEQLAETSWFGDMPKAKAIAAAHNWCESQGLSEERYVANCIGATNDGAFND